MKFAKTSGVKTARKGRMDTEVESSQTHSRVLSASPVSKLDRIAIAQQRMMQKQQGILPEDEEA